jgi:hypothetical protein
MDKCPVCGADTRQGDNYCLNCGQRLFPLTPSSSSLGDATLAASDEWGGQVAHLPVDGLLIQVLKLLQPPK